MDGDLINKASKPNTFLITSRVWMDPLSPESLRHHSTHHLHTPIERMPPGSANEAVAVLLSSVVENVIVYDKGRFYHNFDQ